GHEDSVNSAAFSPDGSGIVTASKDRTARIWDATTGKAIVLLRGHENSVNAAAFSPDGTRIVTAAEDKTAPIWDAKSGKNIAPPLRGDFVVVSASSSPDGSRIVTSDAAAIMIWNATAWEQIGRWPGALHSAAFSPDGSRIVAATDGKEVDIWDAASREEIKVLRAREDDFLYSAAFSPDGSH